jgi:hypothetical protein
MKLVRMGRVKSSESVASRLREVLRGSEGMTVRELMVVVGSPRTTVNNALRGMVDAFVDRWELANSAPPVYRAIWCVVDVPEHCPHPHYEEEREAA